MSVSVAKSSELVNVPYEGADINLLNQTSPLSSRNAFVNTLTVPVMCRYSIYIRSIIPPSIGGNNSLILTGSDNWSDPQIASVQAIGGFSQAASGVMYIGSNTAINYETTTDVALGDPTPPYDIRIIIEVL